MSEDKQLDAARREATAARERVLATVYELQYRVKPQTLAHDAIGGLKRKSGAIAEETVEAVKRRPIAASAAAAGVAALLGLGIFARWRRKDHDGDES